MTRTRRHPARQTAKHLLRWTRQELGATRLVAFCGYSSTTGRDFAPNLTRDGKQIVTCTLCVDALHIGRLIPPRRQAAGGEEVRG